MNTWIWRAIAGALTVIVVVAGILVAWRYLRPAGVIQRETQTQRFDQSLTRLTFDDFEASDIVVGAGEPGQVSITREFKWTGPDKPAFTETWAGGELVIAHNCSDIDSDDCSIKYTVLIPAGAAVIAATSSGDVSIRDLTGPVSVQAVSGDVRLERLAGSLDVQAVSGDVRSADTGSGPVTVQVTSGDTSLSFTGAPRSVDVQGTSGDVSIGLPAGVYAVEVETTSGQQTVTVDRSSSGQRVTAKTVSGDVTVSYR
jgi:hypothetical protein